VEIFEKLDPFIQRVQRELKSSVKKEFPQTLKEPIYYFLDSPGKKIRPLLTLLSCEAVGGDFEHAIPAAVGIELFHDFTLIHDDIMDKDDLRRGRQTIHKRWGEDSAILVGDALIGLAYEKMLQCHVSYLKDVLYLFNEAFIKVCEGQALDKEFENLDRVVIDDYIDMISKKTAWLFKLSCHLGSILGGGSESQIENMQTFGNLLGVGFQIQDDLLDYIGEESTLGKKVGSDLKMDKKTYITIKYQQHIAENRVTASRYPSSLSQYTDIHDIQDALGQLGIAEETQLLIDKYIKDALNLLEKVQPLNEDNRLYQIVSSLQKRNY
jgi:geranylgeranyl diphosphate synthase type II